MRRIAIALVAAFAMSSLPALAAAPTDGPGMAGTGGANSKAIVIEGMGAKTGSTSIGPKPDEPLNPSSKTSIGPKPDEPLNPSKVSTGPLVNPKGKNKGDYQKPPGPSN